MRAAIIMAVLSAVLNVSSARQNDAAKTSTTHSTMPATASGQKPGLGFIGLHGGMFDALREYAKKLDVHVEYIADQDIASEKADLSGFNAVFLQHLRAEAKDHYISVLKSAKAKNPKFRAFTCSGEADNSSSMLMPNFVKDGTIVSDAELQKYYNSNKENLRKFLIYVLVKHCGREGKIEPPAQVEPPLVYHPNRPEGFPDIKSFLEWAGKNRGGDISKLNRVMVVAHANHLLFQQPQVVDALIREFDKRGLLAVAIVDGVKGFQERELEFKPEVVIHTCHGSEDQENREKLDAPHISSLYTKAQSISEYLTSPKGLSSGELAHQVISQEFKGTTSPMFAGATEHGGGSDEAITPIPERISHIADRTCALIKLRKTPNPQKKVALVYYDREMGKAELMRGTASGMFMNAPRSMVRVLKRLGDEGYVLNDQPQNEDDLLARLKDHGRQVGIWAPQVLDNLARSGKAVLIPADTYLKWYMAKVPGAQRIAIEHQWGPPPGNFLVWENDGKKFIVVPRAEMGNVIILPQPLRGEAHTSSALGTQTHDKFTPPPHNYLATYFWLQEGFGADAVVHFGTHGSEFLLPGKGAAQNRSDWTDMIFGRLPNISVWIINNVGESIPDKRRGYATIVDHLTPPLVEAELSDDLKNLQSDIEKWQRVEDGAVKEKFNQSIAAQIVKLGLDKDLKIDLSAQRALTSEEIEEVDRHLEAIANDSTPISLHVFGEAPPPELLIPYLVRCAGKKFLDSLDNILPADSTGDRETAVRKKAQEAIRIVVESKMSAGEALKSIGAAIPADGLPKPISEGFAMLVQLHADFQKTGNEISGLLAALSGRFIQPGPANSPDRNPGAVPTGRNMFVVNPEEIPTLPSWELGVQLTDSLLKEQLEKNGRYPNKVAFTLSPFGTFRDFGVIEAQVLYLMGARPVWDAKRLVTTVEVIPAKELSRPRIDVFLSAHGYYRDQLPTRMYLIDKAVKLIAAVDEPDNYVRQNSLRVQGELEKGGMEIVKAAALAKARMFGRPLGQYGSAWYYYLTEKTGNWKTREDLMKIYLEHNRCVYTEGYWGEESQEAFNRCIQCSEIVIRSWADSVSSPISNKYTWYVDGSLSQAIKYLTGKEPQYYFADVRDPSRAKMTTAEDAINTDFYVRLFNRKWIEGMMKEGYAGADQIRTGVSNMLGWKIMREGSIRDDQWNQVVDIFVHDSKNLRIREWFDRENPHAFQNVALMLMEAARKGCWKADEAVLKELAMEFAKSVVKYGPDGGLRSGDNKPFNNFLDAKLNAPGDAAAQNLLSQYKDAMAKETAQPKPQDVALAPQAEAPAEKPSAEARQPGQMETVKGRQLALRQTTFLERLDEYKIIIILAFAAGLVLLLGFKRRQGAPGKK